MIWFAGHEGYRILLAANVVGYTIAALLVTLRVPNIGGRVRSADHGGYKKVLSDRPAMTVAAANVIFAYCAMLIYFALPVYVVETLDMPAWVVGFLFALNTAQLALGQTLAIRAVSTWRRTRILRRSRSYLDRHIVALCLCARFAAFDLVSLHRFDRDGLHLRRIDSCADLDLAGRFARP